MNGMLFEQCKIVPGFQDQTGAAITSDWVSLKNYQRALILVHEMRGADATGMAYRVNKARAVAGTNESNGITTFKEWTVADVASNTGDIGATAAATVGDTDTWVAVTPAASITGSTTQSKGQWYAIEVNANDLPDTTYQDYDCIQFEITAHNAAHYVSCWFVLYEARYAGVGANNPTAITD
jgi:hypothetical protein